jgi:hypothetical protein
MRIGIAKTRTEIQHLNIVVLDSSQVANICPYVGPVNIEIIENTVNVVIKNYGTFSLVLIVQVEINSLRDDGRGLHFEGLVRIGVLLLKLLHEQTQVVRRVSLVGPQVEYTSLQENISKFQIGSKKVSII